MQLEEDGDAAGTKSEFLEVLGKKTSPLGMGQPRGGGWGGCELMQQEVRAGHGWEEGVEKWWGAAEGMAEQPGRWKGSRKSGKATGGWQSSQGKRWRWRSSWKDGGLAKRRLEGQGEEGRGK